MWGEHDPMSIFLQVHKCKVKALVGRECPRGCTSDTTGLGHRGSVCRECPRPLLKSSPEAVHSASSAGELWPRCGSSLWALCPPRPCLQPQHRRHCWVPGAPWCLQSLAWGQKVLGQVLPVVRLQGFASTGWHCLCDPSAHSDCQ